MCAQLCYIALVGYLLVASTIEPVTVFSSLSCCSCCGLCALLSSICELVRQLVTPAGALNDG
jgi:hypothetical protein